jgi:glycosyltransferase involved in cell wall biosynthesis
MKRATLYICYFGVRQPLVQTQVIPYLRELAKDGIDVTLLTFEPAAEASETSSGSISAIKEQLRAEGIEWHSLRYHKRPSVPATAYDVLNGARYTRSLLRREKFDVLHARSHVPMMMATLAREWSSLKPKIIFDIRGFFPEEYTDAGLWPEGGWLYRTVKRVERWLMREADAFVVLTNKAKELLFSDEAGDRDRPVEVIPCCVDLARFATANEESRARVRSELDIGNRKVLAYVGAFGGWYLTDEMVDLFEVFKENESNGYAMILTQSDPEIVNSKLRAAGYGDHDHFISRVSASEIPRYLSGADFAVSFIKKCYSKQASSPTKNAEYLASGLPIIANSGIGDVDEQITANGVGTIVTSLDRAGYIKAFDDIKRLGDIAERCMETAKREFDLETVGGARYRRLYARLLKETES